jgi:hypothetical protein
MRVFHFLSKENALSDIALRRIRISRYSDLNDPFELLAADMGKSAIRKAMRKMKDHLDRETGLLCFSANWKNPVLWSHYASKHRGICLGFELDDRYACKIDYVSERLPVVYRNGDPTVGVDETYVSRLTRTKFTHWEYEEEVRMFVRLDEGVLEDGSYFLPFGESLRLREIILGPLCPLSVEQMKQFATSIDASITIRKARLAHKKFQVVPDQRYESRLGRRKKL